ncbi:hypothetical protein C8J57DRAFT_1243307 [Mycena rebaudengoi]|nr:hypothetical protein C8J57DRAFT_1243307 [Mycena rebaudengoi]
MAPAQSQLSFKERERKKKVFFKLFFLYFLSWNPYSPMHLCDPGRWRQQLHRSSVRRSCETNLCLLSQQDINKILPNFHWMHEPGIHLGFLTETLELVFVVDIGAWSAMQEATWVEVQESLQVVMDYSHNAYAIKNNAASQSHTPHAAGNPTCCPTETMFGLGWHGSMEENKTLASYAPINKDEPEIIWIGVLSFADVLDGKSAEWPFTNSFTATYHRFSNWLHCDNNYVPIAIGLWWEAECDGPGKKYEFLMDADHNKTKGGEFMWGKFGFGVDFEKTCGLVEIYWHSQEDYHGTLQSTNDKNFT